MKEFESCDKCKHAKKSEYEYPCNRCVHCVAEDHYEPMTNADRIRSMNDDELKRIILCPYDTAGNPAHIMPCVKDGNIQEMVSQEYCEKCILKWLKSEVDDQKPSEQDQPAQPAWKDQMLRKFIGRRE